MTTLLSGSVILPVALVLLIGFLLMPMLNVVRVDARGMGTERDQPWRSKAKGLMAAAGCALTFLELLHRRLARHPLFKPLVAAGAVALVALLNIHVLMAMPIIGMSSLTEGQHAGEFLLEERCEPGYPSREKITVLSGQNLKAGAIIGRVSKGIGRLSIPVVAGTGTGTVTNVYSGPEVQVGNYVMTCTAAVANGGVFSIVAPDGTALEPLTMTPGAAGTTKYRSRHINFTITDATDFVVADVFTFVVSTTAPTVIGGTGTGTISALALGPDAKPGNYRVYCITATTNGGTFQVFYGGPDGGESIGSYLMTAGAGTATAFETRQISFTLTDATDFIVGDYFDVCVFNQLSGGKIVAWDPTNYDGRATAVGALYDNIDATSADTTGVIVTRDATFDANALQWGATISAADKNSAYNDLAKRNVIVR